MEESRIDYRRVSLGLRAPRLAVLIDSNCQWSDCLALVQTLTGIWGGATFAVIPTDGQSISPLFWRLLKLHDPDWLMAFDALQVSDGLEEALQKRHSVASQWGDQVQRLWPDGAGYPLTAVYDALPDDGSLPEIVDLTVKADALVQLMIYASTGRLSDATREKLAERGAKTVPRELVFADDMGGLYELATEIWEPGVRHDHRFYPFALSSLHLGLYLTLPSDFLRHGLVVVCGDRIEDFAYFWTLRALRGLPLFSNVYWAPMFDESEVTGHRDYRQLWTWLAEAIHRIFRDVWGDKRVLVTSASLGLERLDGVGHALSAATMIRRELLPTTVVLPNDFEQVAPYVARFWERENTPSENTSMMAFVDGEGKAVLETPVPSRVTFNFESEMRWIVEAIVEGVRLPTRRTLSELLMRSEALASNRISRDGVAFTAVSDLKSPAVAPRSLLVQPTLRLPVDWEVFATLCEAEDLTIAPSDKGHYERESLRLFGNLESFGREFREQRVAAALFKFLDQSPNKPGVSDEGVKISGREDRVLDMKALTKIWDGDQEAAEAFVNRYLERSLIRRGLLIVKCPYCRRADWYRLAELSDSVTCHRCSRQYVFPADASVYFKLDELLAQALRHGSHLPLLALDVLRRRSTLSFLHTTACDISKVGAKKEKPWLEVDFFAIADGAFIVGECKRNGKLEKSEKTQLKRYTELCRLLRPDRFVVATDEPDWSQGASAFFDTLENDLQRHDVQLSRLTGRDIGWPPGASRLGSARPH